MMKIKKFKKAKKSSEKEIKIIDILLNEKVYPCAVCGEPTIFMLCSKCRRGGYGDGSC